MTLWKQITGGELWTERLIWTGKERNWRLGGEIKVFAMTEMIAIRMWIWEIKDWDKGEVLTGHGLLKLGARENGGGMNRCRNWEQIQIHQVLILVLGYVIKMCLQISFSQWTMTFTIEQRFPGWKGKSDPSCLWGISHRPSNYGGHVSLSEMCSEDPCFNVTRAQWCSPLPFWIWSLSFHEFQQCFLLSSPVLSAASPPMSWSLH